MDAMTRAAEENPNNGDLQYILAVHRYFDGQMQEAAPFFKRAGQLGVNRQLLKGFVKE